MYTFQTKLLRGLILTVLIGLLTACGGGGGSAQSSQPIVAKGVITATGSIWVNGVEYETPPGGSYSSDDDPNFDPTLYQVGQVVSLRGRRNDDGVSGIADEVEYEAEIEGEAGADNTINGVKILTDQTLVPGTRYEVSGFRIGNQTIQATFTSEDDDGDLVDEVKGTVDEVTGTTITVDTVVYQFIDADLLFSQGDIVEVHFDPITLIAALVELEDELLDNPEDGMEAEIEGPVNLTASDITTICEPLTTSITVFVIGSKCIDWSSVPSDGWQDGLIDDNDLVSGLRVEAEGHYDAAGVLIAEKIKGRGNQVRITAIASSIDGTAGTLVVFDGVAKPIQVSFESGLTEIDVNNVTTISSANDGEGLEIRGIRTGTTDTGAPSVLALRIKDDSVSASRQELRAVVDDGGANSGLETITVMGISSLLDANTQLEDEDVIVTASGIGNFLDSIDDDGIVEIGNGPNDVVEVRIDTTNGDGSITPTFSPYAAKQVEIEREDD